MSNQWCRNLGCRACKSTPKSFDLLKIWAKSLKMLAKILKIWAKSLKIRIKSLNIQAKSLKIWEKWRPTLFDFKKWRPRFAEKQVKTIFWGPHHKNGRQKLYDNFFGKFGKIWIKILCTPKDLLASTPMCQTINNGSTTSWYTGTFAY